MLVRSEPICDQTEFLHSNGTCVTCLVCGPGEQLSEVAYPTQTVSLLAYLQFVDDWTDSRSFFAHHF